MNKVTKDTKISDIIEMNAEAAAPVFFSHGMGCLGCAMASGETVEEASAAHGMDCNKLLEELNKALGQ
ncbi:MAG: DUF1858 domain-containing protein [Christensenellales bacterium]